MLGGERKTGRIPAMPVDWMASGTAEPKDPTSGRLPSFRLTALIHESARKLVYMRVYVFYIDI